VADANWHWTLRERPVTDIPMVELDAFRSETRAWLEANCPAEMRKPTRSEKDACWGGRNWKFQSDAQRQWLEAMAGRGWTVPDWPPNMAWRAVSARGQGR
jgi:hypothetical protein